MTFKLIRPRVWSDGEKTIVLPCDKKTYRVYATVGDAIGSAAPIAKARTFAGALRAAQQKDV